MEQKIVLWKSGVGHIKETSFPIGGKSTHAVLTSHTGLAKAKLFDDIRLLEKNDYFNIYVLEEVLTYKVTDIRIVLPYEVSSLLINKDEDIVTLVTCTPYGVNSHRLLVTGSRTDTIDFEKSKEEIPKIKANSILINIH